MSNALRITGSSDQQRAARRVLEGALVSHLRRRGATTSSEMLGRLGWFWTRLNRQEIDELLEAACRDGLITTTERTERASGEAIREPEWQLTPLGRPVALARSLSLGDSRMLLKQLAKPAEEWWKRGVAALSALGALALGLDPLFVLLAAGAIGAYVIRSGMRKEAALRSAALAWCRLPRCRPGVFARYATTWRPWKPPVDLAVIAYAAALAFVVGVFGAWRIGHQRQAVADWHFARPLIGAPALIVAGSGLLLYGCLRWRSWQRYREMRWRFRAERERIEWLRELPGSHHLYPCATGEGCDGDHPPGAPLAAGGKSWRGLLDERVEKKWDSFSWTTLRALVSSFNHILNAGAPRLVPDIRNAWLGEVHDPQVIDRQHDTAFVVMGDPGEQDASQFVVAPALRAAVAGPERPAFMVICSDVIYPSGDVNDYVDGFYVPYCELSKYDRDPPLPVYALPGNHDWYDGLAGFMWHFCQRDKPLPAETYGGPPGRNVVEWVLRLLWRRPSRPKPELNLQARRQTFFTAGEPRQESPYFAIDTKHVRLVCIDTGIDGTVDTTQAKWLLRVSKGSRPKVLLTGKPVLVDRKWRDRDLAAAIDDFVSVKDIVACEAHGYVAAIGGDIHNFQHYRERTRGGGPIDYIVSGGGGAYMSATHPLARIAGPEPVYLYPGEASCLSHFARLVLPRVWRLFRALMLAVLGLAGAAWWVLAGEDESARRSVLLWAAVGVGGWLVLRSLIPPRHRNGAAFRFFVAVAAAATGVLLGLAGWWLAPDAFGRAVAGWAALAAGGAAAAVLLRVTHWWRAEDAFTIAFGWRLLIVVSLLAGTLLTLIMDWLLGIAAAVTAIVAIGGWHFRGAGRRVSDGETVSAWPRLALLLATAVQALDALLVVYRLVVPAVARGEFWTAVAAVPAGLLISGLAALVLMPMIVFVVALAGRGTLRGNWGKRGRAAQTAIPVVVAMAFAGATFALRGTLDRDGLRVAVTAAAALPLVVGAVFLVDWTRRHALWWGFVVDGLAIVAVLVSVLARQAVTGVIAGAGAVVLAAALGPLAGVLRRRLRAQAYKQDLVMLAAGALAVCWAAGVQHTWVPRAAAAAALVLALTVLAISLAHLFFIGVPLLGISRCWDLPGWQGELVVRWRETEPDDMNRPGWRVRSGANVVFPGAIHPSGPLQQKVAEVFDSDEPPFAKNFLVISTTEHEMTITMRPVTGTPDAPDDYVIRVPLPPRRAPVAQSPQAMGSVQPDSG